MSDPQARSRRRRRIGLIVNPVAGVGGSVGLKGSDGADIQRRAVELGAKPRAADRAAAALVRLQPLADRIDFVTCPGGMGEDVVARCGFPSLLIRAIGRADRECTSAEDTKTAAQEMQRIGVDLLLFVGGDGTARDVYEAVGERQLVLGVPAGVKIHSAVYAIGPVAAGDLAAALVNGEISRTKQAEVIDADEASMRCGMVCTTLCGVMRVPGDPLRLQGAKVVASTDDATAVKAIARRIADEMDAETVYMVGPGTTTRAVFDELGLDKTLLGVDLLQGRRLLASDVNEERLLSLRMEVRSAKILVTPIGGQGYLFGRGNQQISSEVLRRVGKENVLVIATPGKLNRLTTRPLLVDTGDEAVDRALEGHVRVVCGRDDTRVVKVAAASRAMIKAGGVVQR